MIKICEYCGNEFETKRSIQRFCSRICSGKSQRKQDIRKCEWCGGEFTICVSSPQRFCNEKCYGEWKSENIKGENSPLWLDNDDIIIKLCEWCGEPIRMTPSRIDRKFCSVECRGKWLIENSCGDVNPNWKGGDLIKICVWCGKEFSVPNHRNETAKFCSYECMGKYRSENYVGENHPNWKGGISYNPYCLLFNDVFKKYIRDYYNNRCFLCGKTKEENGQNLDVHHVNYDKDCLCGSQCDFVPLCKSCHVKTNNNRKYWEDSIMNYLYPERYFIIDI